MKPKTNKKWPLFINDPNIHLFKYTNNYNLVELKNKHFNKMVD